MDGKSEGLVAIVQGLKNAGLAVTVTNKKYLGIPHVADVRQPSQAKSSMETSVRATSNAGAQVCDDMYTSSYQLAHCSARPSSPPVLLSEFPPQRPGPSRTQGNFAIGVQDTQVPVKLCSSHKNSFGFNRPEKLSCQCSRGTDSFAHSLRKYPSVSPNRSLSSELVQRLLTYMQTKNFSKSSYHTKSARPLKNKNTEQMPEKPLTPKSTSPHSISNQKENIVANVQIDKEKDKDSRINSRKKSPRRESRYSRYKDDQLNNSYDYLTSTSTRRLYDTEVRYLDDVTRCLKDALRQICDHYDRPVVCPYIQNRYSEHRRERHSNRAEHDNERSKIRLSQSNLCCYCKKPLPCDCKRSGSSQRPSFDKSLNVEQKKRKLEQKLYSWLQEIPVHADEPAVNREIREDMVRKLVDTVINLPGGNIDENLQKEVAEFIDKLPMWRPANNREKEMFKQELIDQLVKKIHDVKKERDEFETEIINWVEDNEQKLVDRLNNVIDKDDLADNLIKRVKPVAASAPEDNKETIRAEIKDVLKEYPIKSEGDKSAFFNELASSLTTRLQNIPIQEADSKIDPKIERAIWEWVKDIPELSVGSTMNFKENQETVKNFAKKLQDIQTKGTHDTELKENMENEIKDWLDTNLRKKNVVLDTKSKNKKTQDLIQKLLNLNDYGPDDLNTIISNWLKEIPQLSDASKPDNQTMIDQLTQRIEKLQSEGRNEEIQNEVTDWLNTALKNQGVYMNPQDQSELVKKLLKKLESRSGFKLLVDNIWKWIKNIPDFLDSLTDEVVEELAEKIQSLGQNADENDIKAVTYSWLTDVADNTGKDISPHEKDELSNKFITDVLPKKRKRWAKPEDLKQVISDEIAEVIESMPSHVNLETKTNLQDKISSIVSRHIDNIEPGREAVKDEIAELIEKDGKLSRGRARKLSEEILTKLENNNLPPQYNNIQNPDELEDLIKDEVKHILDTSDLEIENREEIENILADILADQAMRGEYSAETKNHLQNVLNNSNLPGDVSEKLARRLATIGDNLNTSSKYQESTKLDDINFTPSVKKIFEDTAVGEILEYTKNIADDNRKSSIEKWIKPAQHLAKRTTEIITAPDSIIPEKQQKLKGEAHNYLTSIGIKSKQPKDIQAEELADKLQDLAVKTSTPASTSTPVSRRVSFEPRRDFYDSNLPMSPISGDISYQSTTQPYMSMEEKQYMSDLSNKIDDWLETLPIDLSSEEGKIFKDVMIKDLAGDIVDRQKYLQLNPDANISDQDELEHLKYQVFRWLNKLPDVKELMLSISKTNELMNAIKEVPVPEFASHDTRLDLIRNEISKWFESIPPYAYTTRDRDYQQKMISKLAYDIEQLRKTSKLTESVFIDLLNEWLNEMVKARKESLSEGLKGILLEKDLIELPRNGIFGQNFSRTEQNESDQTIRYGLDVDPGLIKNIMMDWSEKLPFIPGKSIKDIENAIDQFIPKLIDNAQKIEPGNVQVIEEQILTFLKQLPIDMNRIRRSFVQELSSELNDTLMSNLTDDILGQNIGDLIENIQLHVLNWLKNQEFYQRRNSTEKREQEKIVSDLARKLKDMLVDPRQDSLNVSKDDRVVEEIKSHLRKFPMDSYLKRDDQFLTDTATEILECLKGIKQFEKTSKQNLALRKAADVLYENVKTWCDNLPIENGNTAEEKERFKTLKQNIASKLINVIGDLNMRPEIFGDEFLYEEILIDEIDKLFNTLPKNPQLEKELPALKADLIEKIKEAKNKVEDELAGHAYKQQLRDAISKTLPSIQDLSQEKRASFDMLTDDLADAFINLNFAADNDELRNKYKQKICDEIITFCNDYLKQFPATPVDTQKLNRDLYAALQKVPIPKDETIKSQVELSRIKDEINNWLKDLPLNEDPAQKLQKNKIVSVLAKRLHELEKEKEINSNINIDDKIQNEIKKWVYKLPIRSGREDEVEDMIEQLQKRLKETEATRRFSLSNIRRTTDILQKDFGEPSVCPYSETCRRFALPSSTLSSQDREYLDEIRRRSMLACPQCIAPFQKKDASVTPKPIDDGSQTDINLICPNVCSNTGSLRQPPQAPQLPTSPRVIVKEYYWDSTVDPSTLQNEFSMPCSGRTTSPTQPMGSFISGTPTAPSPQIPNMHWSCSQISPQQSHIPPPHFQPQTRVTAPPCGVPLSPHISPHSPLQQPRTQPNVPEPCPSQTPFTMPRCMMRERPCITPSIPQMQQTPQIPVCRTRQAPCAPRRSRKPFNPPCFQQVSSASSPIETDVGTSSEHKVTRLGSLDDVCPRKRTCLPSQPPKKSTGAPDCDWTLRVPQKSGWGTACPRRRPQRISPESRSRTPSKERKGEKCRCQSRLLPKTPQSCEPEPETTESMRRCPKCRGAHCPHPSYFFFR